jgi:hypothetical protein
MKTDDLITEVQFRKFKDGDIIAVFPYEIAATGKQNVLIMSYMHIGQHSGCSWNINQITTPAKQSEYNELYKELVSLGYNLKVIKRRSYAKYLIMLKLVIALQKKQDENI